MTAEVVNASISPDGLLDILSKSEVAKLLDTSQGGLYRLFRSCSLAVLNSGSYLDDGKKLLELYEDVMADAPDWEPLADTSRGN